VPGLRPALRMADADEDVESGGSVRVPRCLLREVLADGCCPLHLRLQLAKVLADEEDVCPADPAEADRERPLAVGELALIAGEGAEDGEDYYFREAAKLLAAQETEQTLSGEGAGKDFLASLPRPCLAVVAACLPLSGLLCVRSCSQDPLQWAMQRVPGSRGEKSFIHDRIRCRLWMHRVADLTAGTKDESVFETRMRSLADQALRARMETEMHEALTHMERQIHAFQAEVDRRLEEQEEHVRRMVEQRVQEELDSILVTEVAKVQAMVEERVRERVSAIFRREVRATVRELQAKLDALAEENEVMRDAFAESNLRAKTLFWALHPPFLQTSLATAAGFSPGTLFSLRRRAALACACHNVGAGGDSSRKED